MIHTISSSGDLYRVNRDRAYLQDKLDKRKALLLSCGIFACVTVATMIWIIYA